MLKGWQAPSCPPCQPASLPACCYPASQPAGLPARLHVVSPKRTSPRPADGKMPLGTGLVPSAASTSLFHTVCRMRAINKFQRRRAIGCVCATSQPPGPKPPAAGAKLPGLFFCVRPRVVVPLGSRLRRSLASAVSLVSLVSLVSRLLALGVELGAPRCIRRLHDPARKSGLCCDRPFSCPSFLVPMTACRLARRH